MALTKKSAVDETLEVVRDLDKFNAILDPAFFVQRIEDLAKAKSDADAFVVRAGAKLKDLQDQMDREVAVVDAKVKAADRSFAVREASIARANEAAMAKVGETQRHEKALSRREAKLAQDVVVFGVEKVDFAKEVAEFATKVERFEVAAKAACAVI